MVPLAMHVNSRPHAGETLGPLPRRSILSLPKLIAEGSPAELQLVLGWHLDTRRLLLSLPKDKVEAWSSSDINVIISTGTCLFTVLEQLIGQLNHAAYLLPTAQHFLGRLRYRIEPRYRNTRRRVKLMTEELSNMVLWKTVQVRAHRGISLNLLVTKQPNRICWSDACPFGISGYSLDGHAWRIQIPHGSILWGNFKVINLLDFIGMAAIWLECLCPDSAESCILAIGDNTSGIVWLHHTTNLPPDCGAHKAHLLVARHIATTLINHDCCIGTQDVFRSWAPPGGKHTPLHSTTLPTMSCLTNSSTPHYRIRC